MDCQIIAGMPQYKFGIVFIGSRTRDYSQKPLYNLPDNLTYMVETFMFEEENKPPIRAVDGEAEDFEAIEGLYTGLERVVQVSLYLIT